MLKPIQSHIIKWCPILYFVLSLGLSAPWPAYAEKKFTAQVTHVYDGDTIKVKIYHPCTDTRPCQTTARIRLAEIDTPEHDQPYGHEAQKALEELVQWQDVNIVWTKKDSYNRFIAQVYLDQDLINHEMIREGHAWVYPYFTSDPQIYQLEHTARLAQKGVWQRPVEQLIPPWIWRRSHKRSK